VAQRAAIAEGIAAARGPKGGGGPHPHFVDFVSTGGVFAFERCQFFLWTILAWCAFLFMTFSKLRGRTDDPPGVPDALLQLIAVSSLSYLAGKIARKPGPVLYEITPSVVDSPCADIKLSIMGRSLSPDAGFTLVYNFESVEKLRKKRREVELTRGRSLLRVVTIDESRTPDVSAKHVELTLINPQPEWLRGKPSLTIRNPDGQAATWPFVGTPEISAVQLLFSGFGGTTIALGISGSNLPQDGEFSIDGRILSDVKLSVAASEPPPAGHVTNLQCGATEIIVTIDNQDLRLAPGMHTLIVRAPSYLAASHEFRLSGPRIAVSKESITDLPL
jgi:hypothetical protein